MGVVPVRVESGTAAVEPATGELITPPGEGAERGVAPDRITRMSAGTTRLGARSGVLGIEGGGAAVLPLPLEPEESDPPEPEEDGAGAGLGASPRGTARC